MIFNRKKMLIFWMIGWVGLFSSQSLQAQQYKTDVLFLKHRQSAKIRLLLKQEQEFRQQRANPIDVSEFLNDRAYNNARLQFDAANKFLESREATKKRQKNWNIYLEEKAEAEGRLQKGGVIRDETPQQKVIDQIRQNYLEKARRHREILRKSPDARQFDAKRKLLEKKARYEAYVAQKDLHSKRKTTGDLEQIRRSRFSAKATDFKDFTQTRERIRQTLKTGVFAQERQKELSAKREDYKNFTQKNKQDREEANLIDLTPEELLKQKFSEKAEEFRNYVALQKKHYANQREFQADPAANRPKYQQFLNEYQDLRQQSAVIGLAPEEAFKQKFSKKATEFQQFVSERKRQNTFKEGEGLGLEDFRRQTFRKNRDRYNDFVASRQEQRAAGGDFGLTKEEIQQKRSTFKAPVYAQFVEEKKGHDKNKKGGGKELEGILKDSFRRKSTDFKKFLENQKNQRIATLAGDEALPPEEARKKQKSRFENFTNRQKELVDRRKAFEKKLENISVAGFSPQRTPAGGSAIQSAAGSPQNQRFETRALKYQDFLTRARNSRARVIARARNQQ